MASICLFAKNALFSHLKPKASQKLVHALTARAFGAHKERKVLAVGSAHRQHLPLRTARLRAVLYKKTTFEKS